MNQANVIYQANLYQVEPTFYSRGYWICQLETEIPASVMRQNLVPQELWEMSADLFSFESDDPKSAIDQLISRLKSFGLSGKVHINK
jgi:nicotinamide mononucleotide adenylyltransferase